MKGLEFFISGNLYEATALLTRCRQKVIIRWNILCYNIDLFKKYNYSLPIASVEICGIPGRLKHKTLLRTISSIIDNNNDKKEFHVTYSKSLNFYCSISNVSRNFNFKLRYKTAQDVIESQRLSPSSCCLAQRSEEGRKYLWWYISNLQKKVER